MTTRKVELKLTQKEYEKIIHALCLAHDWQNSLADAHRGDDKKVKKYQFSAAGFIALREKLSGVKYVDPVTAALGDAKSYTLTEIAEMYGKEGATKKDK